MTTQISASMVKELRETTGAGMMDAKNALIEADGDMSKAAEILRQKGILTAEKKSGRVTAEGLVQAYIANDARRGVLFEVNCETDFVARGESFQELVNEIADQLIQSNSNTLEDFLREKSAVQSDKTVEERIKDKIAVIKENIGVRRFIRYSLSTSGLIHSYIHTGGKIGVLVEIQTEQESATQTDSFRQFAKDLSMHIASSAPEFLNREEIPSSVIEEEKRIEMGKEDLQNKPPEIREKIVMGRIDKLLAQRVLLEQPFVKDPSKSIADLVKEKSTELGTSIQVKKFARYMLGEGIEKRQDDFAQEVMAQVRG